jgi:hypothetical protein
MHERRVDADDEIEIGDRSGRLAEIPELGRKIDHAPLRPESEILGPLADLQRIEARACGLDEASQAFDRERAPPMG